jgi:hypothetical protein
LNPKKAGGQQENGAYEHGGDAAHKRSLPAKERRVNRAREAS